MIVSYNWLKELVEFDESPEEISDILTMLGLEATLKAVTYDFTNVVVGEILSVGKVPDSDHLNLCEVNVGDETATIVCGAPNVETGQKVAVAKVGAILPGGFKIKKAKIRGQESRGMICAEDELGLGDNHDGIMVLDGDAIVGSDFKDYLNDRHDWILDLDLTPNRGDAFSHIGVARDLAAKLGTKINFPGGSFEETGPPIDELAKVRVSANEGAHRYAARVIQGINIGPSPKWLADRISTIGMRSINNVVDASNLVMMELGQPLHIFDYDQLLGHEIDVYFANEGDKFTTLDGEERKLGVHHLLIADGKGPVALAGIMGGENSEVTDGTTNILIESAYFAPSVIRKGSKSLDLSTEASKRFERDIDIECVVYALDRVTGLIAELAGGSIATGVIDVYPEPHQPQVIDISTTFTNRLSGLDLTQSDISSALKQFGISCTVVDDDLLRCEVPLNRPELCLEVDLIEEVTRLIGYDTIPTISGIQVRFDGLIKDQQAYLEPIRQSLVHWGFYEHLSVTLTDESHASLFTEAKPVKLTNPLSRDMTSLRVSLIPGLLKAAAFNEKRQQRSVRLFEMGAIHESDPEMYNLDKEVHALGLLMTLGPRDAHWKNHNESDLFTLKGVVEKLLGRRVKLTPTDSPGFAKAMTVSRNNKNLGVIGVVNNMVMEKFDLDAPVAVAELNLNGIEATADHQISYSEIAPYPIVERDLALELPRETQAGDLIATIRETGRKYLRDVHLFDLYSGDKITEGRKSLAFRLYLQASDRTLTDEEVDKQVEKIASNLARKHQAEWRKAKPK